ncbi:MAG: hypothetical protein AUH85_15825 [Chloroflexi bacterium 13_1_40CM_4_68_4]|nr:MAG: hypothetical protein AUH85_15825 [Chloroflexi bacterium 13_1_40CM_4_68_4]
MSETAQADAIGGNARSLDRLRRLVARLDDAALSRDLGAGWTVGVALAHLAFWDRISLERWRSWLQSGQMNDLQDATNLVNNATVPEWRTLGPPAIRALVIDAATAVNEAVASGGQSRVDAVSAAGKPRWAHRHLHRMEHIDQIESALASASRAKG